MKIIAIIIALGFIGCESPISKETNPTRLFTLREKLVNSMTYHKYDGMCLGVVGHYNPGMVIVSNEKCK